MTAPTTPLRELDALMSRWASVQSEAFETATAYALKRFASVDPYDGDQVWRFGRDVAPIVVAAQATSRQAMIGYLSLFLLLLGSSAGRGLSIPAAVGAVRRGVELPQVYERPAELIRYERSIGTELELAREKARQRIRTMVDTDIQVAGRDAAHELFTGDRTGTITGYRRVLRPEMSRGGSCGLCIVASDRIYSREDLMPLHNGCHCVPMPIVGGADPGASLNGEDLARIYEAAGGTGRSELQRLRVEVREHGELGPVLVDARQRFRGPDKVRDAA